MRPNDDTSAEHMRALVSGRQTALNELMALWEAPLLRFTYRYVQNEAVARDLVQETFVRVYLHRERFRPNTSFSTWAFTIAANLCRNHRRWEGRHPTVSLDQPTDGEDESSTRHNQLASSESAPDFSAQQSERLEALKTAIANLPHELRTALLLYEYEDLSYREIANIVGCSEKGVESRLVRARQKLKKQLTAQLSRSRPPAAPLLAPQG
ncbi:MAG: sigma-70 family RNA polymerase sigma factor [Nibricoccus sp.]